MGLDWGTHGLKCDCGHNWENTTVGRNTGNKQLSAVLVICWPLWPSHCPPGSRLFNNIKLFLPLLWARKSLFADMREVCLRETNTSVNVGSTSWDLFLFKSVTVQQAEKALPASPPVEPTTIRKQSQVFRGFIVRGDTSKTTSSSLLMVQDPIRSIHPLRRGFISLNTFKTTKQNSFNWISSCRQKEGRFSPPEALEVRRLRRLIL